MINYCAKFRNFEIITKISIMRRIKVRRVFTLGIMLIAMIIVVASCSKDDGVAPDYVGTWVSDSSVDGLTAKESIVLTSNSFSDLYQVNTGTAWVDYMLVKGSISVNKQLMTIVLTEIGLAFDSETGDPTGTMVTYKAGTDFFDLILQESGQAPTFKSEYSVSGNTLTLKTDNNEDGDYLDEGETVTYTKQ